MTRRVSFGAVGRRDDLVVMAICGADRIGRERHDEIDVVVLHGRAICPHGTATFGHVCLGRIDHFDWGDE